MYTALPDRRKKKELAPLTPVSDTVMQLAAYHYLDADPCGRMSTGFMAQDVLPYFPELLYQRYDIEITNPVLTMDYSGFGIIAVKAIQEQQKIIESQNTKIASLDEEIKKIKEALKLK